MRRTSGAATWPECLLAGALVLGGCSLVLGGCSKEASPEVQAEPESPAPPGPPGPPGPGGPRTARRDVQAALLADRAAVRHASDGGGTAKVERLSKAPPVAGGIGAWRILYTAGEHGVAVGGTLFLQVSPFWGWSTPQVEAEDRPGFTRVSTEAPGVLLEPRTLDRQLLGVTIRGRALARGERIALDYGVGPAGARCDDFAERGSRFFVAVDGDGDGIRGLVADSPGVDVAPGPAAILSVVATTLVRPGETAALHLALLDARANAGVDAGARVRFVDAAPSLGLPEEVLLRAADGARTRIACRPGEEGTFRWRAVATTEDGREFACAVGPLVVSASGPRVLWADLHGHSQASDGTGTPEDYWTYARDVAGLAAAALTDHDHWGMELLDRRPEQWTASVRTARSFDVPGRFVAIPGYEYTDWIHGHRCVLWFGEDGLLASALDPRSDTPEELWSLLRGRRALSIPHHVAGGPIALDWGLGCDPELEPVVEIASVHGTSESADGERRIYAPVPGNFARDALVRGARFGFVGGGDSHDGHPGLAHLGGHNPCSGLAAIVSEELTAEALHAALLARRCYATSGARILLRFSFGGQPMGSFVDAAAVAEAGAVFVAVTGTANVARIDVIHGASVAFGVDGDGSPDLVVTGELAGVRAGDFVYARVVQEDGALAWSSPVFVR